MAAGDIMVQVVDGTRHLIAHPSNLFIRLIAADGHTIHAGYHNQASVRFENVPIHHNSDDYYTVHAAMDGCPLVGFRPVIPEEGVLKLVSLLLLPIHSAYNFTGASWDHVKTRPPLHAILAEGLSEDEAAARYERLARDDKPELAGLLNITTAMQQILLPIGTPLDYVKGIIWDNTLARDRFFAWADPILLQQVRIACGQGLFAKADCTLHLGATCSYKQAQFGEANVQLTFHENDTHRVGGIDCVKLEPDIDYYKDLGAHLILEVLPTAFERGHLTDPNVVYALRWMAGRQAGRPEFDPLYTIEPA
jgi:hypothetical protein